jgi:hypothetical protein
MAAGVFLPRKLIDSASLSAALFGLEEKSRNFAERRFPSISATRHTDELEAKFISH